MSTKPVSSVLSRRQFYQVVLTASATASVADNVAADDSTNVDSDGNESFKLKFMLVSRDAQIVGSRENEFFSHACGALISGRTFHDNDCFVGPWIGLREQAVVHKTTGSQSIEAETVIQ